MKLLLVEDSRSLQRSLSAGLRNSNITVDQAFDGLEAELFLKNSSYDVIVLDIMLPKLDGLEVLKRLRKRNDRTFVLILSARDEIQDRTKGLDLGADDYLIKPFSFEELLSRVRALYRRSEENSVPGKSTLLIGELSMDTSSQTVLVDSNQIALTPSEYRILELLATRRGQIFSHDHIIERLYHTEKDVTRNTIEVHLSSLRRKLRKAGVGDLISTRRGFGYFIEIESHKT